MVLLGKKSEKNRQQEFTELYRPFFDQEMAFFFAFFCPKPQL